VNNRSVNFLEVFERGNNILPYPEHIQYIPFM
jgi:hypothetical protein